MTMFELLLSFLGLVLITETKLNIAYVQFRLAECKKNPTTVKDNISPLTQHQTSLQ